MALGLVASDKKIFFKFSLYKPMKHVTPRASPLLAPGEQFEQTW